MNIEMTICQTHWSPIVENYFIAGGTAAACLAKRNGETTGVCLPVATTMAWRRWWREGEE